ncbi:Mpv17/PMP22 family protein [Clostridiaceae bacterium M8S5]|nr:Mpv17/PMP22 family protein [Clostridiaceae bacterium M8S5]
MKKGDFVWGLALIGFILIMVLPATHVVFVKLTTEHKFIGGFIKFAILSTMGELLAIRITSLEWKIPKGIIYRALIWGLLGMIIVLMFATYTGGVKGLLITGLLPGGDSKFLFAFFVSTIMNLTFAPTMMAFHRITDTYIDLKYERKGKVSLKEVVTKVEWSSFVSFVILKTVPFFWIPAHTITFLLPEEYRVLVAASLSIALGAILAFSKKKAQTVEQ